MTHQPSYAYKQAAAEDASSLELVVMLHEMMVSDLRRTLEAFRRRDIEARTREVDHALLVLDQLQRGLDMTSGGEAAANMARLYSLTRVGLLRAQIRSDASLLTRFLEIFLSLRQAWQNAGASRATVSAADTSDENASRRDNLTTAWTA